VIVDSPVDGGKMSPVYDSKLVSTALTLAVNDPEQGLIDLRNGWNAEVVAERENSDHRRLRVASPAGREIVLFRSAAPTRRPANYPESVPFVEGESVWAGASPAGAAALWISPQHPAEVAAAVVVQSVQSGWDLVSSVTLVLVGLKTVSLTQRGMRRGVSIVADHVMLSDTLAVNADSPE
jgi:hypothetical protein